MNTRRVAESYKKGGLKMTVLIFLVMVCMGLTCRWGVMGGLMYLLLGLLGIETTFTICFSASILIDLFAFMFTGGGGTDA